MSERWGDSARDRAALDRWITRDDDRPDDDDDDQGAGAGRRPVPEPAGGVRYRTECGDDDDDRQDVRPAPRCSLFLMCGNVADGVVDTGLFVLGDDGWIPACAPCADLLHYRLHAAAWAYGPEVASDV